MINFNITKKSIRMNITRQSTYNIPYLYLPLFVIR